MTTEWPGPGDELGEDTIPERLETEKREEMKTAPEEGRGEIPSIQRDGSHRRWETPPL